MAEHYRLITERMDTPDEQVDDFRADFDLAPGTWPEFQIELTKLIEHHRTDEPGGPGHDFGEGGDAEAEVGGEG